MSEPTLIRGAAAMVTLNGVDEVVIFAATPEKLTQALNGITGEIVYVDGGFNTVGMSFPEAGE